MMPASTLEEEQPILNDEGMPADHFEQDESLIGFLKSADEKPVTQQEIYPGFISSNESTSVSSVGDYAYKSNKAYLRAETGTYWYRWYILGLFSLLACMSNVSWNTWGPIETSARVSFGWTKGTISLLSDWGAITYILAVFPSAYVLDVLGLRKATILAGFFLTIGTGLRCIMTYTHKDTATILIHTGQILIGLCGPVAQSAATALSSTWFPPNQRTTATAVGSLASYCGTALSFMLGPHLVDDMGDVAESHSEKDVKKVGDQIMRYLYMQCGFVGLLLFLVLVSFPAKPPKPPSATANIERVSFTDGLKKLIKNPQFQLIAFAYGLSTGVYSAWCSDLALNLKSFNISDKTAGMMGFFAVIAGSVSGISLSILGDKLGSLKLLIILLFVVATASFSTFSLICMKVIPKNMALYYVTCIFGGFTVNGSIPLFFELAVESSYPVAEGINTGFMTFSNNVYCTIFLSLPLISGVGTNWMNWFLVASCLACIPSMLIFKERYHRLALDLTGNRAAVDEEESMKFPVAVNGHINSLSSA